MIKGMESVRQHWEVPAIAHFCSLFRTIFKLIDFDIEDFEEALLLDAVDGGRSSLVVDLLIALLKGCTGRRDVSLLNYNQFLHDVLSSKWEQAGTGVNPLGPRRDAANFHRLPVYAKIKIFHCLCEWRLHRPDVEPLTKNLDGDSLRVNPLGKDESDCTYWYFYGTRLYKEDPEPVTIKILPPRKAQPKKKPPKKKGGKKKKKIPPKKASPPPTARRSRRQAAKKAPVVDSSDDDEVEAESGESEQEESEFLEEEEPSEGEISRAESSADVVKPSLVSRLKPSLVNESGRSSPVSSETGDGMISNRTLRDMIERMYSTHEDDEESNYPPSSMQDEDSRMMPNDEDSRIIPNDEDSRMTTNEENCRMMPNEESSRMEINDEDNQISANDEDSRAFNYEEHSNFESENGEDEKREISAMQGNNGEMGIKPDEVTGETVKKEDEEVKEEILEDTGPPAWDQDALKPNEEAVKRWHLVCDSIEAWKELSERFKGSKVKSERDLHRLLGQEFLPEMENMFVQKEKEQQRKMTEFSRRASDRLEMRRLQREKETNDLTKRTDAERQRVSGLELERQRKIEQEQREHRARVRELEKEKAYRMKQRAREERSRRLELRQERQRRIANGEEVPEELMGTSMSYAEDEALDELDIELEFERMYGQLEKVLDVVKNSPDAEAFRHPVSDTDAPEYSVKIKTPMCFDMMEAKLMEREYKSKSEFINDMNQIFINCLEYNGWMSDYTKLAQKTERCFIKAYKKYFPPSEVIENERARREEWECVTKLGALDKRIREEIEGPKPEPMVLRPQPKKPRFVDSVETRSSTFINQQAPKNLAPKPVIRSFQGPSTYKIAEPQQRMALRTPSVLPNRNSVTYGFQEQQPAAVVNATASQQRAANTDDRPNVYVLPTKDGNRLLKFVTRDGAPASHDLITHLLPQLRKEAYKLPKGLLTLTVDAEDSPAQPQSVNRIQQSTPTIVRTTPNRPSINSTLTPITVPTTATSKRFYDMGDSTFLAIEDGNPFLYKKHPDGSLVKMHQVSREGLVEKLKMIQDRRKQTQQQQQQGEGSRPVCSVAPQRQTTPLAQPPRFQQSLSVPAQVSFQELNGSNARTVGSSTILVPASSRIVQQQQSGSQHQVLVLGSSPNSQDGTQVFLQGNTSTPIVFSNGVSVKSNYTTTQSTPTAPVQFIQVVQAPQQIVVTQNSPHNMGRPPQRILLASPEPSTSQCSAEELEEFQ